MNHSTIRARLRAELGILPFFLVIFLAACAGENGAGSAVSVDEPPPANAAYRDPSRSPRERAADLLRYMTLEEKVGQIIQIDRQFLARSSDISFYKLGSLLSGGGSVPSPNTPEAWADMYDRFQSEALSTRLGIPLIYGVDAVHGHNNLHGAVIFPHNIGLGAAGDPDLVREIARVTAIETAATGIDWTFAPAVTVPQDLRWGRTYEGFGEDPVLVAELGAAAVEGYQGFRGTDHLNAALARPETILATVKHFIGDGGTAGGIDQGNVELSIEDVRRLFLPPYEASVRAGAGSVMASFNSIHGTKVHGRKDILTGWLKEELGFEGLVVSDWAALKQLPGSAAQQIASGINAGIDMIMVPDDYQGTFRRLKAGAEDGSIPQDRIDQAVLRILEVKFALGLFEHPLADRSLIAEIGRSEHRELAREAVRKSIVVLKNENLLPVQRPSGDAPTTILVSGAKADDIGSQSGGWTLDWQGAPGNRIPGTSILEGIQELVQLSAASSEIQVLYRPDGRLSDGDPSPDLVIAVIGESPYAEMQGDSEDLKLAPSELAMLVRSAEHGAPIATVLLSGRPVDIREVLPLSDALLAAWLPGTEGGGVADLLFGVSEPSGKLSFSWPESAEDLPLGTDTLATAGNGVLFPRGYGLSW